MATNLKNLVPQKMPTFDMRLKLDAKQLEELGQSISRKVNRAVTDRADRDDFIRMWHMQYDAIRQPKDFPWENSSSLNIPTTRSILDAVHARVLRAFKGSTPLFRVEATRQDDIEDAELIEKLLDFQVRVQMGILNKWDEIIINALKDGNCIAYVPWRREYRKVRDIEPILIDPTTNKETEDVAIGQPKMVNGQPKMKLVQEDRLVVDRPDVRVIPALDWFMYPANAVSIETAIGCGFRFWATQNDLAKGIHDGILIADQVELLVASGKPGMSYRASEDSGGDASRDDIIGVASMPFVEEDDRAYEMFSAIWQYDYDHDGIMEDCQFIFERKSGIIVAASLYPYWHGERNFINYRPYLRPGAFYGYSLPEIIEQLHAERNAIRNQRVDVGSLLLAPMMAVGRGGRFDVNANPWKPGGILKVDDVTQVKSVSFAATTQAAFAEENAAKEMAEEVSGVSAYAAGASPSRSRTLGEIKSVLAEGNYKFDVIIDRLQEGNNQLAQQIMGLDYQFLGAETEFAITGSDGKRIFQTISHDQIQKKYRIVAVGNSTNSNQELLIQIAETLYQIAKENPLISSDMSRVWSVSNYYLQTAGISDPTPYIGTQEEAKQLQDQKSQQKPEQPINPIQMSGRLDEVTTLALLLKADPGVLENVQTAMQLYAQAGTHIQDQISQGVGDGVHQGLTKAQQAGQGAQGGQGGWNQQVPGGLPALPTDPAMPGIPPGQAGNMNHLMQMMQMVFQAAQQQNQQPGGAANGTGQ